MLEEVQLTWNPVLGAEYYGVVWYINGAPQEPELVLPADPTGVNSYDVVSIIDAGDEITYQVRAKNGAGWGPYSDLSDPMVMRGLPEPGVVPEAPAVGRPERRGQPNGLPGNAGRPNGA